MKKKMNIKYNLTTLALFFSFSTTWANDNNDYVEFDSHFLQGDSGVQGIDVSRFSYKNSFSAGKYDLDIYVNNEKKGTVETYFINSPEGKPTTQLCLTPELKNMLDLQPVAYQAVNAIAEHCLPVEKSIPEAQFNFDVANLKINVTIPQALTVHRPSGYVPPHLWQDGVPALYVNYHLNHFQSYIANLGRTSQTYLGIRAGLNVAGWALVHTGAKSWQQTHAYTDFSSKYQSFETYVRRVIPQLRSEIVIGDMGTSGDLLDGVSLRGVRFTSDDSALPNSQRGYAPIIQGIANSNANVVVKQNGYIIHQISVPAGPFVIDDLNPTGYGGDITVEILESNGEKREFKVPFATLVQLVRPKHFKYQLAYGRYRNQDKVYKDNVLQGTLQYGLFNNLSLNTGFSNAPNYRAYLLGFGLNTPIGAFVADTTWANAYFVHSKQSRKGYSIRASYSVKLPTETYITLATYRYFSQEFYRLSDTLVANNSDVIADREIQNNLIYRPKTQYQLSISQDLGQKGGVFYLQGSVQNYWQRKGKDYQYQVSYSNNIGKLNYSLSYSSSKDMTSHRNHSFYLGFSIPLGKQNVGASHSQTDKYYSLNTYLNGEIADTGINYGLQVNQAKNHYRAISGNLDYQLPYANLSANASYDNHHDRQFSTNLSGAVVLHPKGVTLSQQVGDTFAIVRAKGATGAKINGLNGHKIDYFGNGILPYLSPYSRNYVSISPEDLPLNVEFASTAKEVIPKANHAMLVEFNTSINPMILFEVQHSNGLIIPMGTEAFDEQGQLVGYVVQGGQLFASRLDNAKGKIKLRWNAQADGQCQFNYQVPNLSDNTELRSFPVICK